MAKIAEERLLDTPSLASNVRNRKPFRMSEKVLIWKEFIQKKRSLGTGEVKLKLEKFCPTR